MRDLVVLVPGIMGTALGRAGRDVWALSGSALLKGLTTGGRSIRELQLASDNPELDELGDGIEPLRLLPDTHLIPGFWKIDGYSRIRRRLTDEFDLRLGTNLFEFPYDWRRDNRVAARRVRRATALWLKEWRRSSGNPEAKLILIAHSMGGLVSRYFLEVLDGWRDTRMLITFGTPYRGSLKALNSLANGYRKTIGPLTLVDFTEMLQSFTSVYQLLPTYPCYNAGKGVLQRLSVATDVPNLDRARVRDALEFHREIQQAADRNALSAEYSAERYTSHPIVGTYQRTWQVATKAGRGLEMSYEHPAANIAGDGTVPQESALPDEPALQASQQHSVFVSGVHGSLQNSTTVLNHVVGLMARGNVNPALFRDPAANRIALTVDDAFSVAEPVLVSVSCERPAALLIATILDADSGRQVKRVLLDNVGPSVRVVDCGRLVEGVYRVRISSDAGGEASDVFVVLRG